MIGSMKPWRGLAAVLIAVGLLAVVVPSATMAATRPDDRAGVRGLDAGTMVHLRPDDRSGVRGSIASPPVLHSVTATSDAFAWNDAAAGAALTLGAISLVGLGVLASRRRGRAAQPVATTSEGSAS